LRTKTREIEAKTSNFFPNYGETWCFVAGKNSRPTQGGEL